MLGGRKQVMPNANRSRMFINRGYIFRIIVELVIRHNTPKPKSKKDDQKKERPLVLPFSPVPMIKAKKAKAIVIKENERNGILWITREKYIRQGYSAAMIYKKIFETFRTGEGIRAR
jgi:hypothetical protein